MGDEVRRTQQGNNNAYCQDNELSWFDWSLLDKHADLQRFVKQTIRLRLNLPVFEEERGLSLNQLLCQAKIQWHGVKLHQPDWNEDSHSLAVTIRGQRELFHLILNAYWESLAFDLPPLPHRQAGWRRVIDTYLESPADCCIQTGPAVAGSNYLVHSRSVVLLVAEIPAGTS